MNEVWRRTFLEWSVTEVFRGKVAEAYKIVERAVSESKVYSTFSGGKDSLVMSHIANVIQPGILVVHIDYGRAFIPQKIFFEICGIAEKLGWNFEVQNHEIFETKGKKAIKVMNVVLNDISKRMLERGYKGVLVGLRKEEAKRRKIRIEKQIFVTAIQEYFPIGNWTWLDVWAYIISNNLPYISYYERIAEKVGFKHLRFTTMFDSEFDVFGNRNIENVFFTRWRNCEEM